jgi:hypothetical protein
VNTTSGAITITADASASVSAVNAVYPLAVVDSTGTGTFTITVEGITTGAITYSATIATLYGNINTALNAAFGTSAIVASGASLAALILTFSGTGYSGRPIASVSFNPVTAASFTINGTTLVDGTPIPVAASTAGVTAVTADEGEFIVGSLVQPADGSQTIKTFVDEEDGIRVTDINGNGLNIQFPRIPITGGVVNAPNIVNYPSDPSLQAYVKAALNLSGPFIFSDNL